MEGYDPKKCTIGLAPSSRTPKNCKACGYRCTEQGAIEFLAVKHKTDQTKTKRKRIMPATYKNDPHSPRTVLPIKREKAALEIQPKRKGNYGHGHSAAIKAKIGASVSKAKTYKGREITPDLTPLSEEEMKILKRLEMIGECRVIADSLTRV